MTVRKPVVLITGANGEIGHALVANLAQKRNKAVVSLDVNALDPHIARLVHREVTGSILDNEPARAHPVGVRGRPDLSSGGAAVDADPSSRRWRRITSTSKGRSTFWNLRRAKRSRTAGPSCSSTRPPLPPTAFPISTCGGRPDGFARTTGTSPSRCTGATSCIASISGGTTPSTTSSCSEARAPRVDFRCVRFPGLISAVTVPSGGTSDYASEMIHAAARGEPYACFVRPDSRIPFMAMPDAIEALLKLSTAQANRLSNSAYNVRAFNPSADEIRALGAARISGRDDHLQRRRKATEHRRFVAGRRRRHGGAPRLGFQRRATISSARSTSI